MTNKELIKKYSDRIEELKTICGHEEPKSIEIADYLPKKPILKP